MTIKDEMVVIAHTVIGICQSPKLIKEFFENAEIICTRIGFRTVLTLVILFVLLRENSQEKN